MNLLARHTGAVLMVLSLGLASTTALADDDHERTGPTILDTLLDTDGAEAVVAAALLVDEAES
ncbi:MAG: hypothetical protein OER43_20030 [Gammaproteobacteria bacterium]|nr:hypothetical protein [Gammaproteobacteria bacterium]